MPAHRKQNCLRVVTILAATALLVACGGGAPRPSKAPAPGVPAATTPTTPARTPAGTPRVPTVVASSPTAAARGLRIEALLQPQGPTVEAALRIEAATASAPADLTVTARVTKPGVYPIHLHGGTCRAPSASVGFLGTLVPGGEGRATFQTAAVALPGGTTTLTFELLERNEVIIDVHEPSGAVVACAELRRGGQQ